MRRLRLPVALPLVVAVATVAVGAPLAAAGFGSAFWPKAAEKGYLLYPRTGLCVAPGAEIARSSAPVAAPRRGFRPARSADAAMPPGLGENLNAEWLVSRPPERSGSAALTFRN